jgi:hypothetical protein
MLVNRSPPAYGLIDTAVRCASEVTREIEEVASAAWASGKAERVARSDPRNVMASRYGPAGHGCVPNNQVPAGRSLTWLMIRACEIYHYVLAEAILIGLGSIALALIGEWFFGVNPFACIVLRIARLTAKMFSRSSYGFDTNFSRLLTHHPKRCVLPELRNWFR